MDADPFRELEAQFRQAVEDCQQLYRRAARDCVEHYPTLLPCSAKEFKALMADLSRGLVVKTFMSMATADQRWTREELQLASILLEHVWGETLKGDRLMGAVRQVLLQSRELRWYSLVRPFDQIEPLRDLLGDLEAVIIRLANLVAKCDGTVSQSEIAQLQHIKDDVLEQLRPLNLDRQPLHADQDRFAAQAVKQLEADAPAVRQTVRPQNMPRENVLRDKRTAEEVAVLPAEQLKSAMQRLEELIGLAQIKQEVKTLANFLKLQEQRQAAGLPRAELSLHMVFAGNPGTGKTSVARIVGDILAAMGILRRGHLVETDRSGLVAEYAGQTAPKTNRKIDEALDGVLFVDEAYSLVAEEGDDPYGREAVQTLLKRMEDDRQRLVVILAGYPDPMRKLLVSNPGLASRFSSQFLFDDYTPRELGLIFQHLCDRNHFRVPGPTQAKLLVGLAWLYAARDERFGNGRLVRNIFERAMRRLANRIANIVPVTPELLTVLEPADMDLDGVPADVLEQANDDQQRFRVSCPGCHGHSDVPGNYLGKRAKCKSCEQRFIPAWGEPLPR